MSKVPQSSQFGYMVCTCQQQLVTYSAIIYNCMLHGLLYTVGFLFIIHLVKSIPQLFGVFRL